MVKVCAAVASARWMFVHQRLFGYLVLRLLLLWSTIEEPAARPGQCLDCWVLVELLPVANLGYPRGAVTMWFTEARCADG